MAAVSTSRPSAEVRDWGRGSDRAAPYGSTLALTVTLAIAATALLMSVLVLAVHPSGAFAYLGHLVNQQNQTAKTALYIAAYAVILPLSLVVVPRVADRIAAGPSRGCLATLVWLLAGTLAAVVIAIRLSAGLPWGDGLGVVLVGIGLWSLFASMALVRAAQTRSWPRLARLTTYERPAAVAAGLLVLGALLCVTRVGSLSPVGLGFGLAAAAAVLALRDRLASPTIRGWQGAALDAVVVAVLLLAVPNVVLFHPSAGPPNLFVLPGIVQSQHDFFLGAVNQLLHGGTLLVNAPGSQYGVGDLYFLAGWFHIVPIGYGSFGLVDGLLTALFYVAAYALLRLSGVRRLLAASALALGVVVLIYHLQYPVGVLPEQGPLRFGMPMVVLLSALAAVRWPRMRSAGRAGAFAALGLSSIWAIETFGFTLATLAAVVAVEAWLLPGHLRGRWLARQIVLAVTACLAAHVVFAAATLAGSGHLPDWGQYFNYVHSFLLGGQAGQVTYGFPRWSPALAVGAAAIASAAAIVLMARKAPSVARRERAIFIALAGTTAYAIALFGYIDSRSSTYYLPYVAVPTLLLAVLWLSLLMRSTPKVSRHLQLAGLTACLSVSVLLLAAAWPTVGSRFSDSALAHTVSGRPLPASVNRLLHPPPIDPRTVEGERLVDRYFPGTPPVMLFAGDPDLATEILMHSGRANRLSVGDPGMDSYVPSNWIPTIGAEIDRLPAGSNVLLDPAAEAADAALRSHPSINPLTHPLVLGGTEVEWILRRIAGRFQLRPIYHDPQGFIVARLVPYNHG